jgi:hypothetical protein
MKKHRFISFSGNLKKYILKPKGYRVSLKPMALAVFAIFLFDSCELDNGLTGDSIEGNWLVRETHSEYGETAYDVDIEIDAVDSTRIRIYNFLGLDNSLNTNLHAVARLNGLSITIPFQRIQEHEVSGSGSISADYQTINMSYSHNDGVGDATATAVYERR